jgi:hypothetical protein
LRYLGRREEWWGGREEEYEVLWSEFGVREERKGRVIGDYRRRKEVWFRMRSFNVLQSSGPF